MISGTFPVLAYLAITKKKLKQNENTCELGATIIIPNCTSDRSYEGKAYSDMRSFSGGTNLAWGSKKVEKRLSGLPHLSR